MARAEVTGRRPGGEARLPAKSVAEFCAHYGISRSTFHSWRHKGLAPAVVQPIPGGRVFVTEESEREWKQRHTAATAAE